MAQDLMDNQFKTQWLQLRGTLRDKWRNLTADDVQQINGSYDRLVEKLQERYNYSREEAENSIQSWISERTGRISPSERPASRNLRDTGSTYREPEKNSWLKWLLMLGIPLLLLGTYFANSNRDIDQTNPGATRVVSAPSDLLITENIRNAFLADPTLGPVADNIFVQTTNGVVTLSGNVSSFQQRELIANAAKSTSGVKQVVNNLQVR